MGDVIRVPEVENFQDILVRQQGKEIKGSLLLGEEIKYKNFSVELPPNRNLFMLERCLK